MIKLGVVCGNSNSDNPATSGGWLHRAVSGGEID